MVDGDSSAESQIDALYAVPLEEFTPQRNQLAQRFRRGGERELGERVKRLRKPTVAAWTLNQLGRRQPEVVRGLLDSGRQLRQAQERLLGEGQPGVLREAAAQERRLVDETGQAAERLLRETGQTVSAPLRRKLWETIHAAALDSELGEKLRRGRLLEDSQISDLGLIGVGGFTQPESGAGSKPESRAESKPGAGSKPSSESEPRKRPESQPRRGQARRRLEQARQREQELDEQLQAAFRRADAANQQVTVARAELERAEANAARARRDAERAGKRAQKMAERPSGQLNKGADVG